MQVGLEVRALLVRFLVDFEHKLGGKLELSWHPNRENWYPKTMCKNHEKCGVARRRNGNAMNLGPGP